MKYSLFVKDFRDKYINSYVKIIMFKTGILFLGIILITFGFQILVGG